MRPCLIFDADDTLWENNIYFERAIEEFLELMKPVAADATPVREALRQLEKELIPIGGYGSRNFIFALKETFCRFYQSGNGGMYMQEIERIGERLLNHPMDLRPGVASILPLLSAEYRLLLFSKGDLREQSGKLQRSGLRGHFDRVVIAPEKDIQAYQSLLQDHELAPEKTFMIGNSPRSDVVPALAVGLWAVYMPHPNTWDYEDHPIVPHPRLLHAGSIEELPSVLARQHRSAAAAAEA